MVLTGGKVYSKNRYLEGGLIMTREDLSGINSMLDEMIAVLRRER